MDNKITVTATINADVKKVWDYYTNPTHIVNWNFADPSWHCPTATNEMKVGGVYKARMEAKDGSFGFDFEAVYNEIIPEKKLVYTIADGRKVINTFDEKNGETSVITEFEAESQNPIEMQKDGWQSILNNFKNYIETNCNSQL